MEEMKPVMKNEKKYKLGIGKKIVAALIALGLAIGIGVGLVACNKDPVDQDQNPGIEQPGDSTDPENPGDSTDPENPGEPEDPENPGEPEDPENPGGDIEEPTDPDDGKEDPENPGGPTDPDNPGGEPTDPDDEKEKFKIDTLDELKEYQNRTIYDYFNDNYIQSVVTKLAGRSASVDNAEQIEWAITGTEGETITELQVRFVYHRDASYMYYVGTVTPTEAITVTDILDSNTLSDPEIVRDYQAGAVEADMEKNHSLAEAIIAKLDGTLNDSDQLLVSMDGTTNDSEFGIARTIYVKQITETGVNEYQVTIAAPGGHGDIETLLNSLENKQYRYNEDDIKTAITFAEGMDGSVADIPEAEWPKFEEEEAASTASETYRLYGKMKADDGSSVNIYLPEDLMNELE